MHWSDKENLGRAPLASTTVHLLHHSDPLASHIKFIQSRNSFSMILVGHNFWGHIQEKS